MRELHLFAGAGGGILGGLLLGHRPVCAVEVDDYCQRILEHRKRDGMLPSDMEVHGDIKTFDGRRWRGRADIVAGGFPCQDISSAGKGAGLDGERSGLWWEMLRVVREVEPRYVFVENTPMLLIRGFDRVLGSLADLGYDAEWCVLSAADCGAPHLRKRLWIVGRHTNSDNERAKREIPKQNTHTSGVGEDAAHPDRKRCLGEAGARQDDAGRDQSANMGNEVADPDSGRQQGIAQCDLGTQAGQQAPQRGDAIGQGLSRTAADWWATEPDVGRVAHGVASRVDRLKAIGNGQVPIVAASAWRILEERLNAGNQLQPDRLPRLDPRHV